jgi:hypothetical protein
LAVVAFEAKGTVATTTKDERKKLGLLVGWDEPEIRGFGMDRRRLICSGFRKESARAS